VQLVQLVQLVQKVTLVQLAHKVLRVTLEHRVLPERMVLVLTKFSLARVLIQTETARLTVTS
jgi:hypothetical protein